MSQGLPARQLGMLLVCVAAMAGSMGCRRSPLLRLAEDATPDPGHTADHSAVPHLLPIPEGQGDPEALSPQSSRVKQERGSNAGADTGKTDADIRATAGPDDEADAEPRPTPLLDAALRRAVAEEEHSQQPLQPPITPAVVRNAPPVITVPSRSAAMAPPASPALAAVPAPTVTPSTTPPPLSNSSPVPTLTEDLVAAPPAGKPSSDARESDPKPPAQAPAKSADQAAAPIPAQDEKKGETASERPDFVLKKALVTVAAALNSPGPHDAAGVEKNTAVELPHNASKPLGTTNLHVCRDVRGFGVFEPIDAASLRAGQPILLYCELTGLQYRQEGATFVSRLSSQVVLVDESGEEKVWEQALGETGDECLSRRRDNYVNFRISLPPDLKPGAYRLRLTQTDMVANQTGTAEVPVTIAP